MHRSLLFKKRWTRLLLPAIVGFMFYGSWSGLVNWQHGINASVIAGLGQGSFSFVITLVVNLLLDWLYVAVKSFEITLLIFMIFVIGMSATVQTLIGTKEVILTIAPGAFLGSVYAVVYLRHLKKLNTNTEKTSKTS